jgi:hypothetical protein
MKTSTGGAYNVDIWMAGDLAQAKQVCREFCMTEGFCVHIHAVDYIYTGGQEAGFKVGCISYPRFPTAPFVLRQKAERLAILLMTQLCQHSYSITCGDKTTWHSRRKEDLDPSGNTGA